MSLRVFTFAPLSNNNPTTAEPPSSNPGTALSKGVDPAESCAFTFALLSNAISPNAVRLLQSATVSISIARTPYIQLNFAPLLNNTVTTSTRPKVAAQSNGFHPGRFSIEADLEN
jgi:hypothetical protein